MPRTKHSIATRRRRKKVIKQAKGYYGARSRLFKSAKETLRRALRFAYRDRRQKKRAFRRLWIVRISAACRMNDMPYSRFINGLKLAGIEVDRKILADLAVNDRESFKKFVELARQGLEKQTASTPSGAS